MEYRSLKESCIHPTNIFMKQYELRGQNVSITYSEDQEWYYLGHQNTNEVTFVKIWDNKEDAEAKCEFTRPAHVSPRGLGHAGACKANAQ